MKPIKDVYDITRHGRHQGRMIADKKTEKSATLIPLVNESV